MTNKPPAYQMYAKDWISSRRVRLMKDYQRGWYIQLLNEAWNSEPQCMLPDNDDDLQVLAGVSPSLFAQPEFNDRWNQVKDMFSSDGEYIHNERQLEEFAKQEQRRKQASEAGKLSAKRRETSRKELQAIKDKHVTQGNGRSTVVQPTLNENPTLLLQSSSATSPSIKIEKVSIDGSIKTRIGGWFGRRESTKWSDKEVKALRSLGDITEDLDQMEALYESGSQYNRKQMQTLLNNWQGEMDRARNNKCGPAVINARGGVVV